MFNGESVGLVVEWSLDQSAGATMLPSFGISPFASS